MGNQDHSHLYGGIHRALSPYSTQELVLYLGYKRIDGICLTRDQLLEQVTEKMVHSYFQSKATAILQLAFDSQLLVRD